MACIKMKLSTNLLLLILNINLFAIQYFVFISWMAHIPKDSGKFSVQNSKAMRFSDAVNEEVVVGVNDDVLVYNEKLNHIETVEVKDNPTGRSTWNWNWDDMASSGSKANRFLYLVRHGQYYGSGPYERHLSPMGTSQAQKTAEKLKSLNITFNRFISSTAIRAAETADIIHKKMNYLEIEYSDELREGWPNFPDPASPGQWNKDDPTFELDMPRIKGAFEKFFHRAKRTQKSDTNELIVIHGNIIAYTLLRLLQAPPERWLKIAVLQGSITLIQIQPDGDIVLRFIGDVGHFNKKDWSG